jgi:hypothetical protein
MSGSGYGLEGWGFESLRGAPAIKAVTSRNAGYGPFPFPSCAAIFQILGARSSDDAPLLCRRSVPVHADQYFCMSPGLDHDSAADTHCPLCALLWISASGGSTRCSGLSTPTRSPREPAIEAPLTSAGTGTAGECRSEVGLDFEDVGVATTLDLDPRRQVAQVGGLGG